MLLKLMRYLRIKKAMEIKNHQPRPGFTSVAALAPSNCDPLISLYEEKVLFPEHGEAP